jgi:hypothetical protein
LHVLPTRAGIEQFESCGDRAMHCDARHLTNV